MKLCSFILPDSSPCQAPARKASRANLCRFHDRDQKRAAVIARAQADQARTLARRQARAEQKFRVRQLRNHPIPQLTDYAAIHQALDNITYLYEHQIFDARTTRVMLRCLRVASTNLRNTTYADNRAHAAARSAFRAKLLEVRRNLRIDTQLQTFERLAQLASEENRAPNPSPFPAVNRHSVSEYDHSPVTHLDSCR